MPELDAVYR